MSPGGWHSYGGPAHYYRRGPSRLWWFFLGGAAMAWWQYHSANKVDRDHRTGFWCGGARRKRELRGDPDSEPTTYQYQSASVAHPSGGPAVATGSRADPEPLWRLRSEKEQERRQREREDAFREDLVNAREKVRRKSMSLEDCADVFW